MKNFKLGLKRKTVSKDAQIKDVASAYIQPFKELPSVIHTARVNEDRIDAHDLFSHYTADIIKEDTIFFR
ncbi:hypothetical protein [Haliscomenobacter sp.]|uniref:hypothetical protein n=1 Tax=Haliscomenobacter sp. TaxID=2717303 RepID=UPI003BAA5FBE